MSATTEKPVQGRVRLTRDQAAERALELLTDEPQTMVDLRRQILGEHGGTSGSDVVRGGLEVLEARRQAKRIPRQGWTRMDSPHEAEIPARQEIKFPYTPKMIRADEMFVDHEYQRPLTSFAAKIQANFNVFLFQPLSLSDRGAKNKPRYAIIDGQTRWMASSNLGILELPSNVYTGLTPEDEARLFSRFQTQRKGMVSWHRFRADLRAGEPTQVAIKEMCDMLGYTLGDGVGQMKAVSALEGCYKTDPFTLERVLSDFREAFPDDVPEGPHIRGLHYFLRHYPIGEHRREEVNDQRLINRLRAAGLEGLKRRMSAAKELDEKGTSARLMALAIEKTYASGGRSS